MKGAFGNEGALRILLEVQRHCLSLAIAVFSFRCQRFWIDQQLLSACKKSVAFKRKLPDWNNG